jgi:hypothetical protein
MPPSQAAEEIERFAQWIEKWVDRRPVSIALPYGVRPKDRLVLEWSGLRAALLVGSGPAPSPEDSKRDVWRLPRIQAINGEFGLDY